MANVTIIEMRTSDEPFVAEMLVLAMRSLPSLAHHSAGELESMARLNMSRWQVGRDPALVAWKGEWRAGALWLMGSGEVEARHYTLGLAVTPAFQRQGVARQLLESGFGWLRRHNCHSVSLRVHPANEPALKLYRRFGFEVEVMEMRRKL